MRCKNCPYFEAGHWEQWGPEPASCNIFGSIDSEELFENKKGEDGCRYRMATLDKFHKKNLDAFCG